MLLVALDVSQPFSLPSLIKQLLQYPGTKDGASEHLMRLGLARLFLKERFNVRTAKRIIEEAQAFLAWAFGED